jgi:heat shock protein HslJ
MASMPRRRRDMAAAIVVALTIALVAVACGGSATPTPSTAASGGASLDGTWILHSYVSPGGTQANVPAAVLPSLTFQGNAATGNAGCNTYSGIANIGTNPNTISFSQVQSTKVACPPPAGQIETLFLQALNLSTTYQRNGNELVLQAPGGKPSLTFAKQGT